VEQRKKSGRMGKVDLRGYRSVEGRLREALDHLFGKKQWENIQASSRTDRGVHALKNTFHVDIKMPEQNKHSDDKENNNDNKEEITQQRQLLHTPTLRKSIERKLKDGLNFYLSRQSHGFETIQYPKAKQNPMMNELRILNASKSPEYMDNPYALTKEGIAKKQTFQVDWNARFSATQRTYVYRILCYYPRKEKEQPGDTDEKIGNDVETLGSIAHRWDSYSIPFEWDRAWCLPQSLHHPIDLDAMKEAAEYLVGTHDFSSFRGRLCQRKTPIVTIESVTINEASPSAIGLFAHEGQQQQQKLVTITFVANSFLYRQVRNMVGCLVEVGKYGGKLSPEEVQDLIAKPWSEKDSDGANRSARKFKHRAYSTAPPQGLFLVDVQHGNFSF